MQTTPCSQHPQLHALPQPVQTVPTRSFSSYRDSSSIPSLRPQHRRRSQPASRARGAAANAESAGGARISPLNTPARAVNLPGHIRTRAWRCCADRSICIAMTAHSSAGARLCSGPASCSLRQYSVRVCRGMPAARQLPIAMASRPSCSARRAAGADRSRSASGSRPLMAATYACAAASCHEMSAHILGLSVQSSDLYAGTRPCQHAQLEFAIVPENEFLHLCPSARHACHACVCKLGASRQARQQLVHAVSRPREALAQTLDKCGHLRKGL
jgi:hypothetical protein